MSFVSTKKIMAYVFLLMVGIQHLGAENDLHNILGLARTASLQEVEEAYTRALTSAGSMSIAPGDKEQVLRRLQHLFSVFKNELKEAEERRNDLQAIEELRKMLSLSFFAVSLSALEEAYQKAFDVISYMNISFEHSEKLRQKLEKLHPALLREIARMKVELKRAEARRVLEDKAPTKPVSNDQKDLEDGDYVVVAADTDLVSKL